MSSVNLRPLKEAFESGDDKKKCVVFEVILVNHINHLNFAQRAAIELRDNFSEASTELDKYSYGFQLLNALESILWHGGLINHILGLYDLPVDKFLSDLLETVTGDMEKIIGLLGVKTVDVDAKNAEAN